MFTIYIYLSEGISFIKKITFILEYSSTQQNAIVCSLNIQGF